MSDFVRYFKPRQSLLHHSGLVLLGSALNCLQPPALNGLIISVKPKMRPNWRRQQNEGGFIEPKEREVMLLEEF